MFSKFPKKLLLLSLAPLSLLAGEMQVGTGEFKMKGGFIGLDSTISTDATTYSMVEQHKNLFSEKFFYKYNITWYDIKSLTQTQNELNSVGSIFNNPVVVPSIDYRPQGLDINLGAGWDVVHKDENNFIGLGVIIGASLPWIDSKKSDSNNDDNSDDVMDAMKKSKTKILTYKVGPHITLSKSLNKYFYLYASATYAYQTGKIKNDYLESDLSVDGTFEEYDAGLKLQPFSYDKKIGWFTFSPRLYFTLGYRYSSLKLKNVKIDITGSNREFAKSDFKMSSSITYAGFGYSF
ncbi:hypothetical protein MNB_SM-7-1085 [hydrothermal vent metagenome]|uniref:Outer membrane protein beta-barrel domain-containing protein n=1 Tax=hydrothermal vent metagenome TaxID=652676 RepID=A0A1W1BA48_9ZZZZ